MIKAEILTEHWLARTLTKEEICHYLAYNLNARNIHEDYVIDHVAVGCLDLYMWSWDERFFLGHFLQAVVNNDLSKAVSNADHYNRVALWLYPEFLCNVAPSGLLKKTLQAEG